MTRNKTLRTITLPTMTAAILATSGLAVAQEPIEIDMPAPTWDRWMYPFNATPCTRPGGSVFGFWSEDLESSTDNRMGQVVFGFDTTGQLAPGQTAGMRVTSAVITMTQQNEGVVYDPTVDPYECMLDTPLIEDEDAGQPVELFGVDYRGGYDQETWPCNGPFSPSGGSWGSRYIFNAGYRDGVLSDVSNQIREEWTPTPFAVSVPEGVAAGDVIPLDTVHTFTIDVDDQDIQGYLLDGLERGEIEFGLSTMYRVESQTGTFASFYMKENALVEFGIVSPATLQLTLEEDIASDPCDLNGDGSVGGADLAKLLAVWGSDDDEADFDGDNVVGGSDLAVLLGCWDS